MQNNNQGIYDIHIQMGQMPLHLCLANENIEYDQIYVNWYDYIEVHQSVTWPLKINHVVSHKAIFLHVLTLISASAKIIVLLSLKGKSFVEFMVFESTTNFIP